MAKGLFGNMKTDDLQEQGDRLGGQHIFNSDIYDAVIKMAYVQKSTSSEAQGVNFIFEIDGKEFRNTQWVTNGKGEPFYVDKQDSTKKHMLPGYQMVDTICLMVTGNPLSELDTPEKVVKVYDAEAKGEINKNLPVLVELLDQTVKLAITHVTVDKQKKNQSGIYENTGETRIENQIDKVFHPDSMLTKQEIVQGTETPVFHDAWLAKNKDKTFDRSKGVAGQGGVRSTGNTPPAGGTARPAGKSLFGKK